MDILKFFTAFLKENNIQYNQTNHSVAFSNDGKNYLLINDATDENYFRLTLPKLGIPKKISPNNLKDIFLDLTSKFKVGKVVKIENNGTNEFWLSCEQLLIGNSMDDCSYIFSRSMKILSEMLDDYRNSIRPYLESEPNRNSTNIESSRAE